MSTPDITKAISDNPIKNGGSLLLVNKTGNEITFDNSKDLEPGLESLASETTDRFNHTTYYFPIGSGTGSGTSYNQSLNTDDSVEFASVQTMEFQAANIEVANGGSNVDISASGITFPDGTTLTTASGYVEAPTQLKYLELQNSASSINYFSGPAISFTKTDYGDEVDEIDTGLSITRGNNGGIYNPLSENNWNDNTNAPNSHPSPLNTEWNSTGWGDLTNVSGRSYTTFFTAAGGSLGNNVATKYFIMHDTINNKYYKIKFSVWGNYNAGAPITYTRQQIDGTTGDDIGSLVTFTKPGGADPFVIYDAIDTGLSISRGAAQGIFNTELENSWGDYGGITYSPLGTMWNLDGWHDLSNVTGRTYKTFDEAFGGDGLGTKIIGSECIMHDTINNKYYTVKFTKWGNSNSGAGVSYTRRLINTDFVFIHSENGNEVDDIAEGIGITRGSGGALYNPYDEGSWDQDYSPGGTLWNFDGFQDLSDIENRAYTTFFEAMKFWGIGNKIDGSEAVMKVPSTGQYFTIKFLSWERGGGGAFSYIRSEIDLTKKNEGIRFPDGTVQKTSASNVVKFKGPLERSIQEYYGFANIDIDQALLYNLSGTVKYTISENNSISVTMPDETTASSFSNTETLRNIAISLDNGVSWISVRNGGYGNDSGYYTNFYTKNEANILTATNGDTVLVRYWRNGVPQLWFDPDQSPGGYGNFRGAIIDYHAYSNNSGTIIGQIMVSCDNGDYNITHSECLSGGTNLASVILWHSEPRGNTDNQHREGQLYAYKADGNSDTIKIQWKATMFYGQEYWD